MRAAALLGLGGLLLAGAATGQDLEAGRRVAGMCRTCHGLEGLAQIPVAPNIGGEPADYIATQLEAFRSGARKQEMMSVVAAGLFAFAVSFDQFVISYFLAPPGVSTLPVEIYAAIRKGFTPEINAISTVIILVSMGLMLAVARLYRFGGER